MEFGQSIYTQYNSWKRPQRKLQYDSMNQIKINKKQEQLSLIGTAILTG